jgi:RHS repeat-associated protein
LGRKTRTWSGNIGATATTSLSDVTYTYDSLSRLSTVNTVKRDGATLDTNTGLAGNQPETTTYFYDLLGRNDYTVMPNDVVEDFTFDDLDRLDVMRHYQSDSNNAILTDNVFKDEFDYGYRADNKRTTLSEKFRINGVDRTTSYNWSYDNAGRLTREIVDHWQGSDTPGIFTDDLFDQTEDYIYDLAGNRVTKIVDRTGTANDQTTKYVYDNNDRLTSETRHNDLTGTATSNQNTTYTWNGTQQSSKSVAIPTVSTIVQNMAYGLTGQLEQVTTTTSNGSGTVTARTRVDYRYDISNIRFIAIESNDSNLATPAFDSVTAGRTEYLIDHATNTGYGQTILETKYNASNQAVQRTSYTFGVDEITQAVSDLNPATGVVTGSTTSTFAHDGHGSVRALFGAVAAFTQVYTYTSYGELLAIHNGANAVIVSGSASALASTSAALTSMLYNGEGIDNRTGLYNFRARWYSTSNARFERLDPFAGNPNDPFSYNKYGFVHGEPVQGVDPSGKA